MITEHLLTFLSVFFTNVFYAHYIKAIEEDKHWKASSWSSLINMMASVAVIYYTSNHWTLISACIGAFFGTYAGLKTHKKD
jgi:hypothetical protein